MNSEPESSKPRWKPFGASSILLVVWGYAIFAALWILLSDKAVAWLFSDPEQLTAAATLKGWLFVAITSLLLFGLMRRIAGTSSSANSADSSSSTPPRLTLPLFLLIAAILAITAMAGVQSFLNFRSKEEIRLQAIAELKTQQISDWLQERRGDAEFLQANPFFIEHYRRWVDQGDLTSRDLIQNWLEELRLHRSFSAITLLDAQGNKLLGSVRSPKEISPLLRDTAQQTAADRRVHQVGPYRGLAGNLRLDFVAPVSAMGDHLPLIVLHTDPADWLYRTLQTWPATYVSDEILLCRYEGDKVIFLNELRYLKDYAAKSQISLTRKDFFLTPTPHDKVAVPGLVKGKDYRGIDSLGVARAVPGTDWVLVAKLDCAELYQKVFHDSLWIGLAGAFALFMAVTGFYVLRQRQQLALVTNLNQCQIERIQALDLLKVISDSSIDAIFAKDLAGRYILFNLAASRFVGKPAEEVLGRDDRHIFPIEQAETLLNIDREIIAGNRFYTGEQLLDTSSGQRIFHTTKGPLRDGEGKVVGLFGISRDITEYKQSEQALRASELRYRSLFDNMMNSVVHARIIFQGNRPVDLEYLSANPAFAEVTGISEPVVGRRVSEVVPGYCENNRESLEIFGRVAVSGKSERWEHYLKELDRWFSFMIYSPVQGEVIIVTENITERKRVEEQLKISEERFQQALAATSDGLWDWDLRSGLAYLSPQYYRIVDYKPEEVRPDLEFFKSIVHPDDWAMVMTSMEANLHGETPDSEIDYRLITPAGSVKWIRGRGRVVERDEGGAPLRMIGTITDITVRKSAEEALRIQSQELAQRNEELERFNRATVGRKLDMIALKQQVNELSRQLGREPPYSLAFLNDKSG